MNKTITFKNTNITVNRLGYGAMQLVGYGGWGPAKNHDQALEVLKNILESEVNFIDTADIYGPLTSNLLIKEAFEKFPSNNEKIIATKVGFLHPSQLETIPFGDSKYIRQQVQVNLRTLGIETIDLLQLHRIDPNFPFEEQIQLLSDLKKEGLIRNIGLSQVSVDELKKANQITEIVSVQNRYNLLDRSDEDVLNFATENNIAFIPWHPINGSGQHEKLLNNENISIEKIAEKHNVTTAAIAIAWLLQKSPMMLPIPGTSNPKHFVETLKAVDVELTEDENESLNNIK
jgi:aryl-alcohol dehydrogenase-like predicted oxidoreductase